MMYNPSHPGKLIYEEVIKHLGFSVKEAADRLGVSRSIFSRVINCKNEVSPNLAVRLEMAGVGTADLWLSMQANYDKAQIKKHSTPPVRALNDVVAA